MRRRAKPVSSRCGAFTLVELLVVMAIISILAGLLLPVLQHAVKAARLMNCSSNMKSIGVSCQLYANDFDGCLPPYCSDAWNSAIAGGSGKGRIDRMWACLKPYDLNGQVAQCPFIRGPNWKKYWMKNYSSRSDYFYIMVNGSYYNQSTYSVMRTFSVKSASTKGIVWDNATNPSPTGYGNNHKDQSGQLSESQSCLFLDGHAKLNYGDKVAKRFGLGF